MSSVNTNQKSPKNPLKTPVGESNAEKETSVKETPNVETETRGEDNVEALFLKMMLTESEEKRCTLPRVSRDFDEQRLQDSDEQRSLEQGQETLPLSGFDFRHLKVLRDIPISSFYGGDIVNLSLPLQPLSDVGSFYGFDKESLAAENAALDELYANIKSEKAACSQDQSRNFLLPGSTCEVNDDFRTMQILVGYKQYNGSFPNVLYQPAPTFRVHLQHLLDYVNEELGTCISGSMLADKLVKLQTKYKKLVAEKGKTPDHQDFSFSTPGLNMFYLMAEMIWKQDQVSDVHREVDVHCKDKV